jgi:hypothetical protein
MWFEPQKPLSIAYKELFPVVIAGHVWGHQWSQQHVLFRSDNEVVSAILNSRTSKVPAIMGLLRSILFAAAKFNFTFSSQHVLGEQNTVADGLSRFYWQVFHQAAPWAQPSPTHIPGQLLQELLLAL